MDYRYSFEQFLANSGLGAQRGESLMVDIGLRLDE
jgi:hypothetical protein